MQVILTSRTNCGVIIILAQIENSWLTGQPRENFSLLYNFKDTPNFLTGRWNTGTNPDLTFASDLNTVELERRMFQASTKIVATSLRHLILMQTSLNNIVLKQRLKEV